MRVVAIVLVTWLGGCLSTSTRPAEPTRSNPASSDTARRYRIFGAQQIAADYSADGANWTELDTATWSAGATSLMELTID